MILNDKPAVKINARYIRSYKESSLYDCEGDEVWLPNKCTEYNSKEQTIIIEEWLYKVKFDE